MNIIKNLTFEQLVLITTIVFLTSTATTEKNHISVIVIAHLTQIIILIWIISNTI